MIENQTSNSKFLVFQVDTRCFIVFHPNEKSSFLRIGSSSKLPPSVKKQVDLVVLNQKLEANYQEELKNLKDYPNINFLGLPVVIREFQEKLKALGESKFELHTLPVRTGNLRRSQSHRGLQALFFKNKNFQITSDGEVLFDLNQLLNNSASSQDFQKDRSRLAFITELQANLNELPSFPHSLEEIFQLGQKGNLDFLKKKVPDFQRHSINPQKDELFLRQGKILSQKNDDLHIRFSSNSWKSTLIEVEWNQKFQINQPVEFQIGQQGKIKLSLSCILTEIEVLKTGELYLYHLIIDIKDAKNKKLVEIFKRFRFYQCLARYAQDN